jgi:hypothetical protein
MGGGRQGGWGPGLPLTVRLKCVSMVVVTNNSFQPLEIGNSACIWLGRGGVLEGESMKFAGGG